jgi:hypothetical protein
MAVYERLKICCKFFVACHFRYVHVVFPVSSDLIGMTMVMMAT